VKTQLQFIIIIIIIIIIHTAVPQNSATCIGTMNREANLCVLSDCHLYRFTLLTFHGDEDDVEIVCPASISEMLIKVPYFRPAVR
jgi:hypothetical protein